MKRKRLLSLLLLLVLAIPVLFAQLPADLVLPKTDGQAIAGNAAPVLEPLNTPVAGATNIVSIQPWLRPEDYIDGARLRRKLAGYLTHAQAEGWLVPQTLVVLPEHIGTWLVASGEGYPVFRASGTTAAMLWAALGNLPAFSTALYGELVDGGADDPFAAALFRSKAVLMAAEYQAVFSSLAQQFGVTLVAGSIVLPDPSVSAGAIRPGQGPLYNASFVFEPGGRIRGPVRKVYPIESELPFTRPSRAPLPVFDTPAGRLGVLICADSWYPDTWAQLSAAEIVVVPSFSSPSGIWSQPWQGYNGAKAPADVNPVDIGQISEGEAWRKYALAGRGRHLRGGMNTFLRGDLWDLGDDGRTTAVVGGRVIQGRQRDGAVISSVWLAGAGRGGTAPEDSRQ
ncbi:carbon-nitrogen hydrolase family protein [Microbulbifer sediminum]|uniref:carbon-nitrogen hydrolase family protein n=1 Tax=Microbulbifer sediminum TaxID=2904250 RepID=UPI001F2A55C5|nr:carbon-nitrogen hydrolase family protein [Microbulbifer sediminum]